MTDVPDKPGATNATEASAVLPWWANGQEIEIPNLWLVVERGPDVGKRHPLGERTTIGREHWCDIGLTDTRVSKEHCELAWTREGLRLRDLESTNGIRAGNILIHDITLTGDHRFEIGGTTLRVEFEPGTQKLKTAALDPTGSLVGSSPVMQRLFSSIRRFGLNDMPVLVLGETGTGKTVLAEALHNASRRAAAPFVAVNCGSLSPHLVEDEMFGHVRGAFTGAETDHDGLFVQARGGTVFLDEIGELSIDAQVKLLRILDTNLVRPLGARREVPVDFRLVCATNRNLQDDVRAFRFREDLFHRINVVRLTMPPLRERVSDIGMLAQWFTYNLIQRLQATGQQCRACGISGDAIRKLERYSWPGNVRELKNAIWVAVNSAESMTITAEDLMVGAEPDPPRVPPPPDGPGNRRLTFPEFKAAEEQREREFVVELLESTGGNVKRAAEEGYVSRTHLKNLIVKHGLRGEFTAPERPGSMRPPRG